MKRVSKKIKVTQRRTLILKPSSVQIRCPECSEQNWMMPAETASGLTGIAIRAIYRHVEAGRVHFQEMSDAYLMICINSLLIIETSGGGNDLTF
jgi:hypothetical protein